MKVSVVKLSKNENTFRTEIESLDGMMFEPKVGQHLVLTSGTHISGGIRTSKVLHVTKTENIYTVETVNSLYEITEL